MKTLTLIILNFIFFFVISLHSNILYSQSSEARELFKAGVEAEQSEKYMRQLPTILLQLHSNQIIMMRITTVESFLEK